MLALQELGVPPGAPKGNQNALKHGRYTAQAISDRKQIAELLREMRELAEEAQDRRQGRFSARGIGLALGW